ncbi:MAG: hypothetical protein U0L19_10935 [Bacteroidales bacterium]|nr:hypothetical protein [Bacteroidales bacterium]
MTSTKHITAKIQTLDKATTGKRFRNILANSGELMESGEIRDLDQLYVMDFDGKLVKISDLNTDPEKQTEKYSVKAQADHGEVQGDYLVPSIEKVFGDCRVWLEKDGLHARMYFANNDSLADHAWAISENASYSIGIDWFPEGYNGVGYNIEEPIGILREISMVVTGNDPRAKTIDHKPTEAQAQGSAEVASDTKQQLKEDSTMSKQIDELTRDEREALGARIAQVLDEFTADVPEDETEPTADDAPEAPETEEKPAEAEEAEKADTEESEQEKEEVETKDTLNSPVVVVKDKAVAQETAIKTTDWLHSEAGHMAFADTLKKAGRLGASFDGMWRAEAAKHMSLDGITGLPNPAPVDQYFVDALEKGDGIISHFQWISAKSFRIHIMQSESRAAGHKKGDTKQNQAVTDTVRDLLVKMVYKRLDLDATELYENPFLIDFRSRELVDAIIAEIERAAIIGDGRSAGTPDLRMFDGTRGFYSVDADAVAGNAFASTYTAAQGANLYDGVVGAKGQIKTDGAQYIVADSEIVTALLQAKANGAYLVQPGARIEDILGVERVYTPSWMTGTGNAYLIVNNAYKHGGEQGIRVRPDFDTTNNTDILLDETPRFGSLGEVKSAVKIAFGE